jgi:hypothetical protein
MIISPLKRTWPIVWSNSNFLHPRIICTKFDWIWPAGSGEDDFKNFSVYFHSFAIISPWRAGAIPFVSITLNPLPPRSLVEIGYMTPSHFYIFAIISPFEEDLALYLNKLDYLHPRIIWTKFDWICFAGSEENFKKFSVYFYSFFAIISPCRKAIPIIWTNLKPLPPRMICAKSG